MSSLEVRIVKYLVIRKRARAIRFVGDSIRRSSRNREASGPLDVGISVREGTSRIPYRKLTPGAKSIIAGELVQLHACAGPLRRRSVKAIACSSGPNHLSFSALVAVRMPLASCAESDGESTKPKLGRNESGPLRGSGTISSADGA